MDLLPPVSGVDAKASDRRQGAGGFAQRAKQEQQRQDEHAGKSSPQPAPEPDFDPLLAELDRLRATDPTLTESGAHRALLAHRAYQRGPEDEPSGAQTTLADLGVRLLSDAAAVPDIEPDTPPPAVTGSGGSSP